MKAKEKPVAPLERDGIGVQEGDSGSQAPSGAQAG